MKVRVIPGAGVGAVRVNKTTTVTKEWTEVTEAQGEKLLEKERNGRPLVETLPEEPTDD